MAFAIMGGLLVATVLTLVFLPTLYVTWFGEGKLVRSPGAGSHVNTGACACWPSARLLVQIKSPEG